jgi:hypothetical protein
MRRFWIALAAAGAAFVVAFVVENIVFISWAVHEYPYNNSMAGLTAFAYGLPVGGLCAAVVFCLVFFKGQREGTIPRVVVRSVLFIGLPVGAVIAFLPLLVNWTGWNGEWEFLILRLLFWTVICGGIAFALGWIFHMSFRRDR